MSHQTYRSCDVTGGLGRSAFVRVWRVVHGSDGADGVGLRAEVRRGAVHGQQQEEGTALQLWYGPKKGCLRV